MWYSIVTYKPGETGGRYASVMWIVMYHDLYLFVYHATCHSNKDLTTTTTTTTTTTNINSPPNQYVFN